MGPDSPIKGIVVKLVLYSDLLHSSSRNLSRQLSRQCDILNVRMAWPHHQKISVLTGELVGHQLIMWPTNGAFRSKLLNWLLVGRTNRYLHRAYASLRTHRRIGSCTLTDPEPSPTSTASEAATLVSQLAVIVCVQQWLVEEMGRAHLLRCFRFWKRMTRTMTEAGHPIQGWGHHLRRCLERKFGQGRMFRLSEIICK